MIEFDPVDRSIIEAVFKRNDVPADRIARAFVVAEGAASGEAPPPRNLITIPQAAQRMQCTERTIQRWLHDGLIGFVRRGRLVRIFEDSLYN